MKPILCLLLGHVWAFIPDKYQRWPHRAGKEGWHWAYAEIGWKHCLVCGKHRT